MYSLTKSLGHLLWDADEDIIEMTVTVLSFLLSHKDVVIPSPIALQLAEALWQLFDDVRLCAPSHRHWVLPGNAVPCGFSGLCAGGPGAADMEGFCFLSNRTTALCSCSPFTSSKR